ncbi:MULTISPECIES: HD domain-containing protein [Microbacterium]|uniref:HDIG domain-containing protein n=1 Tax=Microbacterium wangchenii TaxID=2541726 RepID=A0ABX5SUI3_9MICO|nr:MULTISPECIES: HD domain-containing protein [Microbacterium]MCK6065052.1 HDIG domain-containing protein [Microbacterium sp. EYE_512]QBR88519.1 HDIG domain-containing protein [Microbacterium wangchenii]TFV82426.1 HDIG domain-containing protein [Microbacterium sp. dk485]TXK20246.1 HDIG domain-containing protein [Microbacterium wangchenii]
MAEDIGARLREIARTSAEPSSALRDRHLIEVVPELAALAGTPQDPVWHPEGDVLVHSLWAADLAATHAVQHDIHADRRELLVLASLLHDVGKPDTTRRRNGRLTSWGHAERGAVLVRSMGDRMRWPKPLVRAIAEIVATHMAHVAVQGTPSAKAVRRVRDRLEAAGTSLADWAVVVRCDGEARGRAARPDASVPWTRGDARLSRR